jgi:hypothetical protein
MTWQFRNMEAKGDIFKNREMGEKSVILENGIDPSFIGSELANILAAKLDVALVGMVKAG